MILLLAVVAERGGIRKSQDVARAGKRSERFVATGEAVAMPGVAENVGVAEYEGKVAAVEDGEAHLWLAFRDFQSDSPDHSRAGETPHSLPRHLLCP